MDRLKQAKTAVFFVCLAVGVTLFLIYSFASTYVTSDSDSVDKISQLSKSAKHHSSIATAFSGSEGGSDVGTLPAGGIIADFSATSRGDEYRLLDKKPAPAAKQAEPAPAAKPAVVPAEAPANPAPAPVKAPVRAAVKPAAAPKAAPVAAPKAAPAKRASGYEYNLDLLARLITAEAQGEPYEAQVAVGAVVMNRVKSDDWPDTVKGVIYQEIGGYYQFTPVVNGWIDKPAEPECIKAAKEAMNGADPTNGAQFYYDDKVTNQWILAKPVSARFGHMIFAF